MSNNVARRMARKYRRAEEKKLAREIARNECSTDGCKARAKVKNVCITCEYLVAAHKREDVHIVYGCSRHAHDALEGAKKHALTAHPSNLVKAAIAALGGEAVFE